MGLCNTLDVAIGFLKLTEMATAWVGRAIDYVLTQLFRVYRYVSVFHRLLGRSAQYGWVVTAHTSHILLFKPLHGEITKTMSKTETLQISIIGESILKGSFLMSHCHV